MLDKFRFVAACMLLSAHCPESASSGRGLPLMTLDSVPKNNLSLCEQRLGLFRVKPSGLGGIRGAGQNIAESLSPFGLCAAERVQRLPYL